jgi:hypothetical protein
VSEQSPPQGLAILPTIGLSSVRPAPDRARRMRLFGEDSIASQSFAPDSGLAD